MSELALELVEKCLEFKMEYLDLSKCNLSDEDFRQHTLLRKVLDKCIHLKVLDISSNYFTKCDFLDNLSYLHSIYITNNKLSTLTGLEKAPKLKYLYAQTNELITLDGLEKLQKLQKLFLSRNRIKSIEEIESLIGLTHLSINRNELDDIYSLRNLKRLESLDLFNNKIKDITPLQNLTKLIEINVSQNAVENIDCLKSLEQLQRANLRHNRINFICDLTNLKELSQLDLRNNFITDLKPIVSFLKISKNKFNLINEDVFELKPNTIGVVKNPLIKPPVEIAEQGTQAIISYFENLEIQGEEYLYEAKMLIVGQPRAGKTSLRHKLFDTNAPLPTEDTTTRGIDIKRLNFDILDNERRVRKFYCNIWDFGGQQIYQTTHQFFLTQRSLYVLVLDTGKDTLGHDDAIINYWLQAVELLGGNSHLLLVRNEKNERQINIDMAQKRGRFDFLKNDYVVDLNALIPGTRTFNSGKLKDFHRLKEDIGTELKRLPLVGFPMPRNWVLIRNELHRMATSQQYITRHEYIEICERHDVNEFERQMELSRVFHDLGVFLHFQDYHLLEDIIILQNTWATDAVFTVLDNRKVQKSNGKFTDADLPEIWKDKHYHKSIHKKLLSLMMQFELCYQVDPLKSGIYIIPEMLSETPPKGYKWEINNDLTLLYKYDFMPKGMLTRLVVRMHKHIVIDKNQQVVWKTGVKINGGTLDCPSTVAEITEAWNNKQLNVRVQGAFARDMMSKITYQIDELNNAFFKQEENDNSQSPKSRWYKMIPCNCIACKNNITKHFFEHHELIERIAFGKSTIECKRKPFEEINITELIEGVFANETSKKGLKKRNIRRAVKIFISYSNKDRDLRVLLAEGVNEHLDQKREIKYNLWSDKEINLGDDWKEEIEKALKTSKVALLLVSASFAKSKFIKEFELAEFLKRKKEDGYLILPVLIRKYNFEEFEEVSSLNFFKTYYNQYGFNEATTRNSLMPFDVLGDDKNVTDKLLNDYYCNLADHIHTAVTNYLKL